VHSVGVLMSKNNLKRGWCSLCVGCCLWACRVVCVCTPGVGVHVMYYECVRTCTSMSCSIYMLCVHVKLHVCTLCLMYVVCTCGTRYMCTCVCYTHDIHTHIHYCMCEYDWIHERMDQSSPIGSRGLNKYI